MTNPCNQVFRLKIDKSLLVILNMANKWLVKPKGIINSIIITITKVFTIMDFHVVLEENGTYPMILIRFWLTKSHAKYMIIKAHFNSQKVLFTNFVKSSKRISQYDDEFGINQIFSSKIIYINDFNETVM